MQANAAPANTKTSALVSPVSGAVGLSSGFTVPVTVEPSGVVIGLVVAAVTEGDVGLLPSGPVVPPGVVPEGEVPVGLVPVTWGEDGTVVGSVSPVGLVIVGALGLSLAATDTLTAATPQNTIAKARMKVTIFFLITPLER